MPLPTLGSNKPSSGGMPKLDKVKKPVQDKPSEEEVETYSISSEKEAEFVQLTEEQVIEEDRLETISDSQLEEDVIYQEKKASEPREMSLEERENYEHQNGIAPNFNNEFEPGTDTANYDDKRFIDEEETVIVPYGGDQSNRGSSAVEETPKPKGRGKNPKKPKKSKKGKKDKKTKVNAKDFDGRNNRNKKNKAIQTFSLVVFMAIFGMGVKNTFFPSYVFTETDIENIALRAIGQTGFPMEKGRAFAEQFTEAYFTLNTDDANARKQLDSFYVGGSGTATNSGAVTTSGKTVQKVVGKPRVFDEGGVTDNIAFYHVSTLISDRDGKTFAEDGNYITKNVGLNVVVYYDEDTQELSIAKDSPQVIPTYSIGSSEKQPEAAPIGTGTSDGDLYPSMAPTINGFLKAYALATPSSHEELNQYVKKDADPEIFNGFGGIYTLRDEELTNTTASIYPSSESEGNKEYKAVLDMNWYDKTTEGNDNLLSYRGKYVMTLVENAEGKYYVTSFRPYVYTPNPDANN